LNGPFRETCIDLTDPLGEAFCGWDCPLGEAFTCLTTPLGRLEADFSKDSLRADTVFELDSFAVRDSTALAAVLSARAAGCDGIFCVPLPLVDSFLDSSGEKRGEELR
jgi:hypothetical protein